jgi:AraC-like DNA-binding protein
MREQHERIHEVCNYILEHHDEALSHEDMARRIHVTRSHFSRIFKRATKRTYQEFVNEVRLGHACRLLVETDESITEIALNSGFNNLSNFNRRFRQKYRCSPREYRGKLDQGANDA